MNAILDFLNQPIVLTLVTLIVGSYLLSIVAERRSRNDRLKDKAIEFLTDAANTINAFVPLIYRQLRTGKLAVDQAIEDGMTDLFTKRLGIHVGSQAFLKNEQFAFKYFKLLDELASVVVLLTELEQGSDAEEIVKKVRVNRKRILEEWPLANESFSPETGQPADELILLMDVILHRITDLFSKNLKEVMR